ncbi:hypothetical protein OCH239_20165 [Roseivivax halodurans JCM 10272]|uniref:Uncharacterized protein n=1 Tax=Roseivivax halodurans JCM 10272 TaxID=1449350 RepID=X7E8C9_9RHOB|nr:hypothetical protein OCH239_20165 [Roseivivax halodurans JCM 10272]
MNMVADVSIERTARDELQKIFRRVFYSRCEYVDVSCRELAERVAGYYEDPSMHLADARDAMIEAMGPEDDILAEPSSPPSNVLTIRYHVKR